MCVQTIPQPLKVIRFTLLILSLAAVSASASAVEKDADASAENLPDLTIPTPAPVEEHSLIDTFQARFSSRLEAMVKQIDRFFATETAFEESTDSYLLLSMEANLSEQPELFGNIKAKIDLPAAERRLKLLIESDPEDETPRAISDIPSGSTRDDSYYLSLEHQFSKTGNWDIRPSLGIKAGTPLNPFARVRAIRYFKLDDWLVRLSTGLFWFQNGGTGINATLNQDHALSADSLFRSSTTLFYNHDEQISEANQTFSLFQRTQKRRRLVWQAGLNANDEADWQVSDYYLRLLYRSNLFRKWFFFDIQPELVYSREDDFDPSPRLLLRLEAFFGQEYL
jgi:hypothetical protein